RHKEHETPWRPPYHHAGFIHPDSHYSTFDGRPSAVQRLPFEGTVPGSHDHRNGSRLQSHGKPGLPHPARCGYREYFHIHLLHTDRLRHLPRQTYTRYAEGTARITCSDADFTSDPVVARHPLRVVPERIVVNDHRSGSHAHHGQPSTARHTPRDVARFCHPCTLGDSSRCHHRFCLVLFQGQMDVHLQLS